MRRPKNVLLLVVDSLRADHLSCYGYHKQTPNIDHLASESTQYMNAWAAGSYTAESIPHILTENLYLQLRKQGYIPTVVHSNHKVSHHIKTMKNTYVNIDLHEYPKKGFINTNRRRLKNLKDILFDGVYRDEARADEINEVGMKAMEMSDPFFVCLWYMDVHSPYFPPYKTGLKDILLNRRFLNYINRKKPLKIGDLDRLKENYDGEIAYLDSQLRRLLRRVPEDTLVIFTADHGEEFMEDRGLSHRGKEIPALRHVPLLIRTEEGSQKRIHERFHFKYFDKWIKPLLSA